nr:VOC family protein [Ktedonosporobacter rubrisoli]
MTDVEAWRNKLEAHGIKALDAVPIPGYARFEIRDPFGNRLEFIQALT